MTEHRTVEERIALWFEEEAVGHLPDQVLEATFDRTRAIRRRPGPSTWRPFTMPRTAQALVAVGAAAIVLVVGVSILRPTPRDQVGGPSIATFKSPQYGYTVDLPTTWDVVPAINPWPAGGRLENDPASVDHFRFEGSPTDDAVAVAAQPAPAGTTATTWLAEWERIRDDIGGHCFGSATPWIETTVAGLPAWHLEWRCDSAQNAKSNWDEYTFLTGGMGYVVSGTPSMVDLVVRSFHLPSPSATLMPSPSPSGDATGPIDTSSWTTYTSGQYGFTIGHPADWTETPATRAWTFEADAVFDPASPSRDSFYTEPADGQGVRVSAWSVTVEPPTTFETSVDLEPWVEAFCRKADHTPCTGIHDRAVPLCLERRDCHPGLLVPFSGDVVAFFTNGAPGEKVTIVAVWRPDSDPAVARFGGARRLLEAFLSTMCVWPEDARPPFDAQIPGC